MEFTLEQIESLLNQQKKIVIDALLNRTSSYNSLNTEGRMSTIDNIDKEKFTKTGMETDFPKDILVLRKYKCY
jgi:hypothetical protein